MDDCKELTSLAKLRFQVKYLINRVSSVLNKDVKNFGPAFLNDGLSETCWNSEQGNITFLL